MAQQRWEYLTLELNCRRGPLGGVIRWFWSDAPDEHYEADDRLAALVRLQALGEDGWELVSTTALSLDFGAGGLSGITSAIEYTLKRPF
jgi:hypothetical protein